MPEVTRAMPATTPPRSVSYSTQIQPYFFESTNKAVLGNYFGYYDGDSETTYNLIGVDAADPQLMFPQDIIHDAAHAADFDDGAVNPLKQKIFFNPSISLSGAVLGSTIHFGSWARLSLTLPFEWRTHSMGLTIAPGTVTQTVEGKRVTLLDYLQGNVQQVLDSNALNKQLPLVCGKIINKQSVQGLADLDLSLTAIPLHDERTTIAFGLSVSLPTSDGARGEYLFEPLLGSGGHTLVGLEAQFSHQLTLVNGCISLAACGFARHRIGLSRSEIRMPNIILFDDSVARFARYSLGCKQNTQRLIPMANLITQPFIVTPGSATDLGLSLLLTYAGFKCSVGYRLAHTEGERIQMQQEWPGNVYGQAKFAYEADGGTWTGPVTYKTFKIPLHSATRAADLSSTALSEERLQLSAAATPAQSTHGLTVNAALTHPAWPELTCFAGGSYHFTQGSSFGLEGFLVTAGCSYTF